MADATYLTLIDDRKAQALRLGEVLRERRKALGISMAAAAEAAQISRVTWHRLEKGEITVALGSLLGALQALGLELRAVDPGAAAATPPPAEPVALPLRIHLQQFPALRRLAWQVGEGMDALTPREALGLYERNARHLDEDRLEPHELALIRMLREVFGGRDPGL